MAGGARFEGRTVLVTGGSSGIGAAIVGEFVREGATVVAAARRADALAQVARQAATGPGRCQPAVLDVRDLVAVRQTVAAVVQQHGRLDVLVNCAGVADCRPVLEVSEQTWRDTFETNLTGAFFASQEAARHMVNAGGGVIVNVTSIDAFTAESPQVEYCASKAGLQMVTRCIAYELGHLGVRCNAVAPGFTRTPMTENDPAFADVHRNWLRRIPLRRAAQPIEQARVVTFLASDEASYVNGETIVVDAGATVGFWYYPDQEPGVPE